MKQFEIGQKVFAACYRREGVRKPCPVCYGQTKVKLILGNEEEVILPCDYCGKGFDFPKGYVTEYEHKLYTEEITITGRDIRESFGNSEVTYYSGNFVFHSENLFRTEGEALTRALAS
jgi:hypothetical protein